MVCELLMIDRKYISPGLTILKAAWVDKGGSWDFYEFAWVNNRWVMLSTTAFEIMTKPEKFK